MIPKSWDLLPVVAHPGPPRAIIDNEAGRADARPLLFYTASALEQARLAGYKTTTPDFCQALHFRDSVGIRQNHVLSGGIGYFTGRNNVI